MPPNGPKPKWYFIPMRVLLVTFLLMLLSFAVSLLLGIIGIVAAARLRGVHPNMILAYRHVAFPFAISIGAATLVAMSVMEIRRFHQARMLAHLENNSRPNSVEPSRYN